MFLNIMGIFVLSGCQYSLTKWIHTTALFFHLERHI